MQNNNFNKWILSKMKTSGVTEKYVRLSGQTVELTDSSYFTNFNTIDITSRYGGTISSNGNAIPVFGGGVDGVPTQTTANTYNLDSPISTLNILSATFNDYGKNISNSIASITVIAENTTSEAITVCELGLMYLERFMGWEDGYLLLRETFDAVTLQPNETRSFTINFM